jgi:hypothetical protein
MTTTVILSILGATFLVASLMAFSSAGCEARFGVDILHAIEAVCPVVLK